MEDGRGRGRGRGRARRGPGRGEAAAPEPGPQHRPGDAAGAAAQAPAVSDHLPFYSRLLIGFFVLVRQQERHLARKTSIISNGSVFRNPTQPGVPLKRGPVEWKLCVYIVNRC